MKDAQDIFGIGCEVNVEYRDGDMFQHDFTGTVVAHKGELITVRDQDGDAWDCDAAQLSHNSDQYVH